MVWQIPVAARSQVWVCGLSPAEIVASNPAGVMEVCVCVACCKVEISATGRSLVQRNPTECGGSVCDL